MVVNDLKSLFYFFPTFTYNYYEIIELKVSSSRNSIIFFKNAKIVLKNTTHYLTSYWFLAYTKVLYSVGIKCVEWIDEQFPKTCRCQELKTDHYLLTDSEHCPKNKLTGITAAKSVKDAQPHYDNTTNK